MTEITRASYIDTIARLLRRLSDQGLREIYALLMAYIAP